MNRHDSHDVPFVDACAVIGRHWPVDGPHSAESCASAATAVAELVRYLNDATKTPAVLPFAVDGYDLVGRLAEAAQRFEQLAQQLAEWAHHLVGDPSVRHDNFPESPGRAAAAADDAAMVLSGAQSPANALARALLNAQNGLAPLWNDLDDGTAGGEQR